MIIFSHSKDTKRLTSNNLLLGGGFYQRVNANYAIYCMAFYNITDQPEQNFLVSPVFKSASHFGLSIYESE
jgi:hypothetical protein